MPSIAKVEPLTSARALRGPFDYRLPEALQRVGVGSLLVVPFGRRRVLGVVVDLAERSEIEPERLAAPLEALEQGVPPDLVRLASWMARAFCSTPARALGLVLPPGVGPGGERPRVRTKRRLVAELLRNEDAVTPKQRAVLHALAGVQIRWDGGSGTAAGVDESGALRVDLDGGGWIALDAGEVHLLP